MNTIAKILIISCILTAIACAEEQDNKTAKDWQTDFQTFLKVLKETEAKSKKENEDDININDLNKVFLNKSVEWTGTLKYINKERPYFADSFISIDKETKASVIMYYSDPAEISKWKKINPGSKIEYTGIIKTIHIDNVLSEEPFVYVDLIDVKPIKVTP